MSDRKSRFIAICMFIGAVHHDRLGAYRHPANESVPVASGGPHKITSGFLLVRLCADHAQAALPSMSRWRPEHLAAVVRVSQGLVQVRVIKHLPEPIYGLPISLRMVGSHTLDRSQCKRENSVAASLQRRSYRLRTDELAESHHCRSVSKIMRRR
jgi:hypothetical protein